MYISITASQKLDINGEKICLESDGTLIDEDEILILMKKETLILLESGQQYVSAKEISFSSSLPSTVNLNSANSLNFDEETNDPIPVILSTDSDEMMQCNNRLTTLYNYNLEYQWTNFNIPWDKIPADMILNCEKGEKIKSVVTQIVHIIINEMRSIKAEIPTKALKSVAIQLVKKHPDTFADKSDDGEMYGDGCCTIFSK